MDTKEDIKEAIKGLLPLKVGKECKERLKDTLKIKGSITAAQAIAASIITKAIEGEPKAISLICDLCADEVQAIESGFNVDIRVVD